MTVYNKNGYLYLNFMLDGKRKQKALKMKDTPQNRKIADKEIVPQLLKKIALGDYGEKKEKRSFKYYADFFLEQKSNIASFKHKNYCYTKVIEFFGKYNVDQITRFQVKKYLGSLNIRNESKAVYKGAIKEILDLAVDDGIIENNVALNIKFTTKNQKEAIKYFKKEEVLLLLQKAREPLRTYLEIAFNTGMRPEEILALKYNDIKNGFVKIQRVKRLGEIKSQTKTLASKRTVPFNVDLSKLTQKSFYLFDGIADVSSFKRQWRTLLKNCNLEHRGIYHTRHTFATHLLRDGVVTINELSGLLGHTKVSTTLEHYASVIDGADHNINSKMKNFCYHSVTLENSVKSEKCQKADKQMVGTT